MKAYTSEQNLAVRLARQAGSLVRRRSDSLAIVSRKKGPAAFDFTTNQDMAAERLILAGLAKAFPHDAVLSEESAAFSDPLPARLWIVDPLDGTKNYAHGLKTYGVSISLYDRGAVQVAAVCFPVFKELFTAVRGRGVYLNGVRLRLMEAEATLRDSVVAIGFPHQRTPATLRRTFRLCEAVLMESTDILRTASAVADTCTVAAGQVGAYITSPDIKPWDIAAGVLFVEEQGGFVSDPWGGALDLFQLVDGAFSVAGVMAKNDAIHREVIAITKGYF